MDQAAFDRTVSLAVEGKILKAAPTGTVFRNDLAQKALAALGTSVDTKGIGYQKQTGTLTEGGK
jgi:NitT/TauT family transport system substrate-binding protein